MSKLMVIGLLQILAALAMGQSHGKSWYRQTHFKALTGQGNSCSESRSNLLTEFDYFRLNLAKDVSIVGTEGFSQFVGMPRFDRRTCGECAISGESRHTTCLVQFSVEYFIQWDDGVVSGKPHGEPLYSSPWFIGAGSGLDCLEAKYEASRELFRAMESASSQYEFDAIDWFHCGCDREAFPFHSECRARVHALWKDGRKS